MHHVHMSTGFMLVLAIFFVGTLGLILWYRRSTQRDRLDAQRPVYHTVYDPVTNTKTVSAGERPAETTIASIEPWYRRSSYTAPASAPAAPAPSYAPAPSPVYAPSPIVQNPMGGFATGLILGDILGHSHSGGGSHGGGNTTIINEAPSSHSSSSSSDSSSSWFSSSSSSSSDSGFSWSDSSSSSSSYSDSSSSGGFDASW